FLRTAVNDFMDCVHHIWCPLFSQEFQDLPDGAETTLTDKQPVQDPKPDLLSTMEHENVRGSEYYH
ncbi:hypothetical protein R1D02_25035, partial [Escherichia coli]